MFPYSYAWFLHDNGVDILTTKLYPVSKLQQLQTLLYDPEQKKMVFFINNNLFSLRINAIKEKNQ